MRAKIVTRDEAIKLREAHRAAGKRVGFTSGVFDILHPGHVEYLEAARAQVDVLIVGVNSDSSVKANKGDSRPINGESQRAEVLAGLQAVDAVFLFSELNNNTNVQLLKPDLYLKAGDYSAEKLTSKGIVEEHGGHVQLVPFRAGSSTTDIIDRISASARTESGGEIEYERRPAVFVDRDGTINEHVEYLSDPNQFKEIPGSFAALKRLQDLGYRIIIVTNQPGIGLGYFSREDFFAVNREMMRQASRAGLAIDRIYFCQHSKADGCDCRKPATRFLMRAERDLNVDLSNSFVVGDMSSDVQLGKNGGCRAVLVKTGRGGDDGICDAKADFEAPSLEKAADWIAQQGKANVRTSPVPQRQVGHEHTEFDVLSKLSGTLGHDFNALLGSILGCATLIGQKTSGRDGRSSVEDLLEILRKAANRGLALSKRLIAVASEGDTARTRKTLLSCVEAVVGLLASTHGDECLIEVVAPSDVEVEVADFTVVQMLLELCENSLEAMQGLPERFILFHVERVELGPEARTLDLQPGTYGRVSLIDHGEGLDVAEPHAVFKPGKASGLGRGLGSSMLMAQSVMRKHGGTVTIASRRQAGTNISLYFPALS